MLVFLAMIECLLDPLAKVLAPEAVRRKLRTGRCAPEAAAKTPYARIRAPEVSCAQEAVIH